MECFGKYIPTRLLNCPDSERWEVGSRSIYYFMYYWDSWSWLQGEQCLNVIYLIPTGVNSVHSGSVSSLNLNSSVTKTAFHCSSVQEFLSAPCHVPLDETFISSHMGDYRYICISPRVKLLLYYVK